MAEFNNNKDGKIDELKVRSVLHFLCCFRALAVLILVLRYDSGSKESTVPTLRYLEFDICSDDIF